MKLMKYRDTFMHCYTWFWVNENDVNVGPYFDTEEDAILWVKEKMNEYQSTKDDER